MNKSHFYPFIRFGGFKDPWKEQRFEEWGTFYYGFSCPKWSVTDDAPTPCIRYGELYTKFGSKIDKVYSYTNIPKEKLKFSNGTEVLIPRVGEDPLDYTHCTWLSLKNVAIGEMISVFNTDQDPHFSAIMFNAKLRKDFAVRVEGGSVTNLYYEKLKNIYLLYPSIDEQIKIANFFEKIDKQIEFLRQKYEKLIMIKEALMKELFPSGNTLFPNIRFSSFSTPWVNHKLGSIAKYRNGKAHENDIFDDGQYVVVNSKFVSTEGRVRKYTNNMIEPLYKGEIAFVLSDIPNGKAIAKTFFVDCDDKYTLNQRIAGITVSENHDPYFVGLRLNRNDYFLSFDDGCTQTNLSVSNVKEFECCYPESKSEEQKISSLLLKINELIELNKQKFEKFGKIKQAFLQNMFA